MSLRSRFKGLLPCKGLLLYAQLALLVAAGDAAAQAAQAAKQRFVFGSSAAAGETAVAADIRYSVERGYGFEGSPPSFAALKSGGQALAPAQPMYFSVDLPEGAYRVTMTLGGSDEPSDTTVRAELRRLVLQNVKTAPRQSVQQSFAVHVRRPGIPAGPGRAEGQVALRGTREAVNEAWNWDGRLTLEINGTHPVVQAITIEPVRPPLLFVLGDSTVADQPEEPYASWGQMLPRFFGPTLAVASLAQSGESYRDSLVRRRLDKILSLAQPGDTVLMQYGHNDQKQIKDGSGSVATYQEEIRQHIRAFKAAGVQPVVVTSVERRFFNAQGELQQTLADYVKAASDVAAEMQVPLLDLNAASRRLYLAKWKEDPQAPQQLFAKQADGRIDPTHHANYGAWMLAALVAQGLRELQLPVAVHLRADAPRVDAGKPPSAAAVDLRPSPNFNATRPPGDGDKPAAAAVSAAASFSPGFAPERLARLDAAIDDEIRRGRLAGGAALILRDGRVVHQRAYGQADRENGVPMREDTMFRIASMSKAVTTVAAMMLYEEGRFLLREPVARYLPEFANVKVAVADGEGRPPRLEKPRQPLTVRDLLQHTAGLSYGAGPAAAEWKAAGFNDWYQIQRDETLAQWTARLAQLPLQGHPGEAFQYGYATDVLGRLVEVWSGLPLERFVERRITKPLGMVDTHFFVPPAKAARLANVYGLEPAEKGGKLVLTETAASSDFIHGPRKLASGGAGLVSTIGDYGRFLQMLLNGGVLEGVRLLSPASVDLMHRDHLGARSTGLDGEGAGYTFWVQKSPGTRSELGSEGSFGWGSAYFPQYLVDPRQRMVFIFMAQLRPAGDSTLNHRVKVLARQALLE